MSDVQKCEHCDGEFAIEKMTSMEDGWFCEDCIANWQDCFDNCEHKWEPETCYNNFSEPGRFCGRCGGFVSDEDAPTLGITFPNSPEIPDSSPGDTP